MADESPNLLEHIQQKFLKKLKDNLPNCLLFEENLAKGTFDQHEAKAMSLWFHQIAGSAKTFGFAQITELATQIENRLGNVLNNEALQDHHQHASLHKCFKSFCENAHDLIAKHYRNNGEWSASFNPQDPSQQRYTLFIADDDHLVLEFITQQFQLHRIKVVSCVRGDEALEAIKANQPDLVLLDFNLPGINGLEVLIQLKKDPSTQSIPVMMLTKRDENNSIINSLSEGAIDYITKPFDHHEVVDKVLHVLQHQNIKILIIDDDILLCELLYLRFQKLGFSTIMSHHGKEALEYIRTQHPDLVLLDIMIPEINGLDVLEQIRRNIDQDLPVLILTVKSQHENIMQALRKGADDYIIKPFDVEELQAKVVGILQRNKKISS